MILSSLCKKIFCKAKYFPSRTLDAAREAPASLLAGRGGCHKNNKDTMLAQKKEYRKNNKDTILVQMKKYRTNNRDTISILRKKYCINNKEKILYINAKRRSKERNLEFNIDAEYIKSIYPKDNMCPVLHIPLIVGNGKVHKNSPTLDRIIPELGYIKGNIRVISHRANSLKMDSSYDEAKAIFKDAQNIEIQHRIFTTLYNYGAYQ